MLQKIRLGALGREMTCNLNLISIQSGEIESKASRNKYFSSIIRDTIKSLKRRERCFLFNQEQIQAVKRKTQQEKILCVIEPFCDGIWVVRRK